MTAYCRMDYLKSFASDIKFDFIDENYASKVRTKMDLLDFLLKGSIVKTDLDPTEIEHSFDNPVIKSLMKNGRLIAAKEQFEMLNINDGDDFFLEINSASSVLLIDNIIDEKAKQFEEYHGYHCINSDIGFSKLFSERVKSFQKDEGTNWNFAKEFLKPHNSIVLADPYLFNPDTLQSVKELLIAVTSPELIGNYYLSLIGTSNKSKNDERFILGKIEQFKSELKMIFPNLKLVVEHHFCNVSDFHDRYIITNNTCVFTGYGLDMIKKDKAIKDTTWVAFKPFKRLNVNGIDGVFFYKIMQDKLKEMRRWIDRNGVNQTLIHCLFLK